MFCLCGNVILEKLMLLLGKSKLISEKNCQMVCLLNKFSPLLWKIELRTQMDRMTCIYDTVEQVKVHINQAVLEANCWTGLGQFPERKTNPVCEDLAC